MDVKSYACVVLTVVVMASSSTPDKRLVLHSDIDISHELNAIKTLLTSQNQSIHSLQSLVNSKDLEMTQLLASQNQSIQSLMSIVNSKDLEIAQLKAEFSQMKSDISTTGGKSSYVRWGKTTCPGNGSTLVYSGMMAGAARSKAGGGSNYLCLANTPTWDYYDDSLMNGGVRGVEYEFSSRSDISKFFGSNIQNEDAPCAVCETNRATNVMIPGTQECSGDWTKEYSGYLVSDYYTIQHSAELVCLDRRPDVLPGSQVNDDNALLYLAEVTCGSSSLCPPYVEGRELTCVVCSI